jgi:hypothetical protein
MQRYSHSHSATSMMDMEWRTQFRSSTFAMLGYTVLSHVTVSRITVVSCHLSRRRCKHSSGCSTSQGLLMKRNDGFHCTLTRKYDMERACVSRWAGWVSCTRAITSQLKTRQPFYDHVAGLGQIRLCCACFSPC